MTEAYEAFKLNRTRARYFLELHKAYQDGKRGAPRTPVRELPRASVVFAIGALDAYLSDVTAECLVHVLQAGEDTEHARGLLAKVQREIPGLALEVAILGTKAQRTARVQAALSNYLHNQVSNHGAKGVSQAIERLLGAPKKVWALLVDDGWENPQEDLDKWTESRHKIVHQGKKEKIQRASAYDCIELVNDVATRVEGVAIAALEFRSSG